MKTVSLPLIIIRKVVLMTLLLSVFIAKGQSESTKIFEEEGLKYTLLEDKTLKVIAYTSIPSTGKLVIPKKSSNGTHITTSAKEPLQGARI